MSVSDVPLRPRAKINSSARLNTRSIATTPRAVSPAKPPTPAPTVRIKSKVTPIVKSPRVPPSATPHRYLSFTPPHSPPTSTVSFSSRSSVSVARSSESTRNGDDEHLPSTLLCPTDSDDQETDDSSVQNLKAKAKSNRKIADLEITNRSLLAINASLETTKHKQSKEIRDLRRKLRESRLVLPPHAFRAVNDADPTCTDDESDEEDESKDEVYVRIKAVLENLLETGRRALESQPSDGGKGGAKVLSADEVRSWAEDADPKGEEELDPSHVAVPEDSEDEVERTLVPTPSPPPIRISILSDERT